MNAMREHSRSVWMNTEVAPNALPLSENAQIDVAVVGAGIAGLSVAYELMLRGYSVLVLDRGPIAGGMTSRTTAHLAPICDDSLAELVSMRGPELARGFQASQSAAVDRIEAIQRELGIECEFRRLDGILFLDPKSEQSVLDDEVSAAGEIGVEVERGTGLPLQTLQDRPYLRYPDQATFHPLRYLQGLVEALQEKGTLLHPFSAVDEIAEDREGVHIRLGSGQQVDANFVVVATNSPIHDLFALHTKQAPYRTYAMTFEIERAALADALYWDTEDPYHYVRLTAGANGKDILIVGGEDHKTGESDDAPTRFAALESWIRTLIPDLGPELHRWSGQVMDTLDYGAYIGRESQRERIFVATGDSGQGITHGVVASLLIPDLIDGKDNRFAAVYDPARKPVKAAMTFVSENSTAVTNLAQYLAPGEVASVDELEPGQGAIIRDGLTKIAAYRANDGTLYQRSAVCTHLGCHLQWNSLETCWDCPCHGSHFAPDGSVLNGPAVAPLARL
ncbi:MULTISPECIES: FAD-dependent oxidoreductase [unclassified Bosea (in: a-proteobacteria)]|uniref:FAD-dependent oxidoreductase n=1 Tax=unclassified Bosea (in: a-proteobacteria) TaxID=2653178 RepID=UPI000F756B63|nr:MULTISPECIES: FAD-dependent oxidoreductase [unclassified Bosea (in: a-proteobacteria)]AZO82038.1 2Fe-2S ferredoxin [Bosea sp. Tri-49]RXT24609.1 2Fe-2S ferredoxin [Bosea sp. Tri-39]RXT42444.1 2Fe-2S ferredoxin [Bosea sp. Tri-54]